MAYAPLSNESVASPPLYPTNDIMDPNLQYPPPPPNQSPYYISQPTPTVMVQSPLPPPVVVQPVGGFVGHNPQPMQCPTCQQQVISSVRYEAGGATWLIALLICFLGGIFGCCLIPFCVPSCQEAIHTCPSCHSPLGRRSPF